ncbi:MAG: folylpolyglutamate synthase/dihydrofolate synthase family protein [Acidaminococcaceae bacterium]|jgi:dihydrofolate synthase/folylpolyglutamate synthase|uniref:bifunctional folylpolyglutamate synthase/dihydrofolate synthase n=1 Tax=uncultured Phascolarctobacterium sp. TaxID=512296 RepID=UPI0025FD8596|nr:folylpolyglutamate synthase/dihydrofolate synthase family protein [uncultured Phascolarctobacterium sp.]MDO5380116.1 folylpolyglutamate synthase/dihydrofolate synthase family protein [Acidaminococcaceae bacterium]
MNYQESLAYLDSLGKFGIRLGMERIEGLLRELGNPEQQIKTIHVTGTNGKGSVSSMITNILLAANLKTGKFTSPHLVKYNERITINGQDIDDDSFADLLTIVKTAADSVVAKGVCEQPTQFEVLTAAAFLYFALENVDYAVIEVGMGGLWDSTNVITPIVSVITNVSLDHTDRCGKTVERIAMQKAGIIKENVPVVTAAEGDDALGPIKAVAMFKQAKLYIYGRAFWGTEVESSMEGQTFTLHAGEYYSSDYSIRLPGEHQIANTSVAIVAAKLVSKQDDRINELALHIGVANTVWPGRLERIAQAPDVILDGAHNPAGAEALRKALDKYYPEGKRIFVLGMMGDKDMTGVISRLIRPMDIVYTVKADDGARAAAAEELAGLVGVQALAMSSLADAYEAAVSRADSDSVVCICGSLYLVGNFKNLLLNVKAGCH